MFFVAPDHTLNDDVFSPVFDDLTTDFGISLKLASALVV